MSVITKAKAVDEKHSQDEQATQHWSYAAGDSTGDTHPRGDQLETLSAGAAMQGGTPRLNKQFGRYRIEKQLGRGGMGAVYLAEDTELRRRVALKVPFLGKGQDEEVISRFLREARAAATLDHPNICPVHEVGEIDGVQYLAMAYIDGRPLSEYIAAGKKLPTKQVAAVVRKLALALQEAHENGIIHRDLKPANVMVNQRKEPIIMDFGLAQRPHEDETRLTQTGMILGTPAYMSPEQIRAGGGEMGPEVDIYSLGVMFYELLTGQLPFSGTPHSVIGQILTDTPLSPRQRRPELDPRVDAICMKAMAKSALQRYGSMKELAAELRDYIRGQEMSGTRQPLAPPPLNSPPVAEPVAPPQAGETLMVKQLFDDISVDSRISTMRPSPAKAKVRRNNDGLLVGALVGGLGIVALGLAMVWFLPRDDSDAAGNRREVTLETSGKLAAAIESKAGLPDQPAPPPTTAADQITVIPAFTAEDLAKNTEPPVERAAPNPPPPVANAPATPAVPASLPTAAPVTATSNPEPMPKGEPLAATVDPVKPAAEPPVDEGPISIDGKNTEWRNFVSIADIRGDTNTGDPSRDIVRTAAFYTYDNLYVLIETAERPAPKAYWLNLDLTGDGKEDIQLTVVPGGAFWVSIFADGADQKEGTGATCVIDEVYEMKLPLDFLVDVLPETAATLRGRGAAQQIGIVAFTADPPEDRFIDFSKPLISNRRVRLGK